MATITTRAIIDRLVAGVGWETPNDHDAPDNPPAIRIVEYQTPEGAICWGVVFRGDFDYYRYETETQYVRNPRLVWARLPGREWDDLAAAGGAAVDADR